MSSMLFGLTAFSVTCVVYGWFVSTYVLMYLGFWNELNSKGHREMV